MKRKTHEQLNAEYTPVLKSLRRFCYAMIRQTGGGAPESEVWPTTILNIGTAWKLEGTLEQVVRSSIQESMNYYRTRLPCMEQWSRSPVPSRFEERRKLAAYEDLWRRMETDEWTVPGPIQPVVYCINIDDSDQRILDDFFSALYHATILDLREHPYVSAAWSPSAFRAFGWSTEYRRVDIETVTGKDEIRRMVECPDVCRAVLLYCTQQKNMGTVLKTHFPTYEFFVMEQEEYGTRKTSESEERV